jgi:glycosyltransferase involved in cell wall biosynthesis
MDYVIVTYNDIDTIDATIKSIKKQENVNRLIVIASLRSSDGTLKFVQAHEDVDLVGTEDVGLAYARELAIQIVETEWFVFVDGDVVLSDTWIKEMYDNMQYCEQFNLGAMFGYLYRNEEQAEDLKVNCKTKVITTRMFTHNTIIRTDAAKDWVPNEQINAYEDYLLTQHIIKKGYVVFNVRVLSFHDHRGSAWKEATWGGAGAKLSGYYKNIFAPLKYMVGSIYGGLTRTIRTRKGSFLKTSVIKGVGTFWGYMRAGKYVKKS